jgi:hypothetical protein
MENARALRTLVAFVVVLGCVVWAQQATTRPAAQKPPVKKEAKTEKEDDERDEQEGAKKYTITARLPAAITTAFKKPYPNATIRRTAKETEGGKTVYEVESAALRKSYPKATITVAEKLTEGAQVEYELQIKGAAVKSVAFMRDGKVVPPEVPEKEKKQ